MLLRYSYKKKQLIRINENYLDNMVQYEVLAWKSQNICQVSHLFLINSE